MDQQAASNAFFYISGLDKRYKINKRVGWVYVAHNPRLGRSILKIGMSSRSPHQRAAELGKSTGYEGPFRVAYFVHVVDRVEAEKFVHRSLDRFRVRSWEEFFELPLTAAVQKLDEAARRYPLTFGHPGRFKKRPKSALVPQVFRKWRIRCRVCGASNQVRELAVLARVGCSRCGEELPSSS